MLPRKMWARAFSCKSILHSHALDRDSAPVSVDCPVGIRGLFPQQRLVSVRSIMWRESQTALSKAMRGQRYPQPRSWKLGKYFPGPVAEHESHHPRTRDKGSNVVPDPSDIEK